MNRKIIHPLTLALILCAFACVLAACTPDSEGGATDASETDAASSPAPENTDGPTGTDAASDSEADTDTETRPVSDTDTETVTDAGTDAGIADIWNPDVIAYYDIDNGSSGNARPDHGWWYPYDETPGVTTKNGEYRAATPLLGTYDQADPETARQHLYWLAAAGFDAVSVDVTNVAAMSLSQDNPGMLFYYKGCYDHVEVLLAEAKKMSDEGFEKVPKIYCDVRLFGENYDGLRALLDEYRVLYEKYPDQIYHLNGSDKPFICIFADWSVLEGFGDHPDMTIDDRFDYRFTNGYISRYGSRDRSTSVPAVRIDASRNLWLFVENDKNSSTGSYTAVYTADSAGNPECMCASVSVHGGWNDDGSGWDAINHLVNGKTPLERTLEPVCAVKPDVVVINRFNYALVWKEQAQEGLGLYHSGHYEPCEELGFEVYNAVQSEVYAMKGLTGIAPALPAVLSDTGDTLFIGLDGYPTEYRVSASADFAGADWVYLNISDGISYAEIFDTDTVYIQTRNAFGESPVGTAKITARPTPVEQPTAFVFEFEPEGDQSKYRVIGNAWFDSKTFTGVPEGVSNGVLFANLHLENKAGEASGLETQLTVPAGGSYRITLSYLMNGTSPSITVSIDGTPVCRGLNLNNGGGFSLTFAELGVSDLTKGTHTLLISGDGTSCANWEIFLDALIFTPANEVTDTYVFEFEPNGDGNKYVKAGNAWLDSNSFTSFMPEQVSGGASLYANLHVDDRADEASSLTCAFELPGTGYYRITLAAVKNNTSPTVRLSMDGRQLGHDIDLNNGSGFEYATYELGTALINGGTHTLVIEAADSTSRYECWLDCLTFTPCDRTE